MKKILEELKERRRVGQAMSNVCYNFAQRRIITVDDANILRELYKSWDNIEKVDSDKLSKIKIK